MGWLKLTNEENDRLINEIELVKNNSILLKQLRLQLWVIALSLAMTLIGGVLAAKTNLWHLFVIGLTVFMIFSYVCATASGHGMANISSIGNTGCFFVFFLPIYFLGWWWYMLTGWIYALNKHAELTKKNKQIFASYGVTNETQLELLLNNNSIV